MSILGLRKFIHTYLEPADRLAEIICGLTMVLTFTLATGINLNFDRQGARELLVAAIGCNLAWGVIDGVVYILSSLTKRKHSMRFFADVRKTPNETEALRVIQDEMDPLFEPVASELERRRLYQAFYLMREKSELPEVRLTADELKGGLAVFVVNVLATAPVLIPFLVFSKPHLALRVSNALLILLLFVTGYLWGKLSGFNRWLAGSGLMLLGLVLVGVAILLGG
jgi:VIT1/CCC1 family predicted Fe2+/Mn2+ transporter